jgi:sortase B
MAMSNELGRKPNNKKRKKTSILKSFIPWRGDTRAEVLRKLLLIVSLVVLIFSLKMLYEYYNGDPKDKELNDKLESIYSQSAEQSSESDSASSSEIDKPVNGMLDKFVELYNLNSDTIGWVDIPGVLSYPVLQTVDNDFYISHNFEKEESEAGAIFADYRGLITESGLPHNTILYGHNMKSGMFFHPLHNYKKLDFIQENPVITFDTLYEESEWKIFACFLTGIHAYQDGGVLFDYHNKIYFKDEQSFNDFYDEVMLRSYYNTDVDVVYGDEILTLSTCSTEFYDSRFVVLARKVRPGEDAAVDVSKTVINDDKYMPIVWYEVSDLDPPR